MDFRVKENELGYFGIEDKESGEEIVPCLFENSDRLKTIENIERDNGNYVFYIKESKINGFYDVQNSMIVIPYNSGINYYDMVELEKKVVRNVRISDVLSIKIVGESCTEIDYRDSIYSIDESDIKKVDDYELIDDKVLALKNGNEIVNVFDLEERVLLPIDFVVSDDLIITYKEIYHSIKNGYGELSIVDLKNDRYLRNVFEKKYHYSGIVDESYEIETEFRTYENILVAHKIKINDCYINVMGNVIEFVADCLSKNNAIYDIEHGIFVSGIKTSLKGEDSSLYLTYQKIGELKAYDFNLGQNVTLIPIKVNYSSTRVESAIYYEEYEKTVFKSIETGKYYQFNGETFNRIETKTPKKSSSLFGLDEKYFYKYVYQYNTIEAIKELEVDSRETYDVVKIVDDKYAYISKHGKVLKVCDSNEFTISLLSNEKIETIDEVVKKSLNQPEVYEYLSNAELEEEILSHIKRFNGYPYSLPTLDYKSKITEKIGEIKNILSDDSFDESEVDLESLEAYIRTILDAKLFGDNNELKEIKNVYVVDNQLIIEKDDELLEVMISDGFIINLMLKKFKSNLEEKKIKVIKEKALSHI